ncbi:MAG TPA: PHP domain-containing protein, partial [Treponemataceae bacterium]|nr:PHP domain-containing protein [Treponemataceae bacterium]
MKGRDEVKSKLFIKVLSLIMCPIIVLPLSNSARATNANHENKYVISNPYESVEWGEHTAYKAQLHCHTNASDGVPTVKEVVQDCYDLDYDILALTDHGTLNKGWNIEPDLIPILRFIKRERTKMADIVPLSDEEYNYYLNGTDRNGRGMLDVPLGIELNAATPVAGCHLTGYFCEYGQGLLGVYGDYETPAEEVKKAGGITMLSHLGSYTKAQKDPDKSSLQKNVKKFANVFINNANSCVGMGINSSTDSQTKHDRILYDNILKMTLPHGVTPWAFTFSDAHTLDKSDIAFTMHMMEENNLLNLRESMENGTFFSVSRYARYELSDDFVGEGPEPMVTNITVDTENATISVDGTNYDNIVWIADGKKVAQGNTAISLHDDCKADYFIRFYLTGPGGICYSQPFAVNIEGEEMPKENLNKTFDISTVLRLIVSVLDDLIFQRSIVIK